MLCLPASRLSLTVTSPLPHMRQSEPTSKVVISSTKLPSLRWLRLTRRRTSSWNGSATGNASGRRCSRPRSQRGAACEYLAASCLVALCLRGA